MAGARVNTQAAMRNAGLKEVDPSDNAKVKGGILADKYKTISGKTGMRQV